MLNRAKGIDFDLRVTTLWKQTQTFNVRVQTAATELSLLPLLTDLFGNCRLGWLYPSQARVNCITQSEAFLNSVAITLHKSTKLKLFLWIQRESILPRRQMGFSFLHWEKHQCLEFWFKVFIQLQGNTRKNQQRLGTCFFPLISPESQNLVFYIKEACSCSCMQLFRLHSLAQARRPCLFFFGAF